MNIKKGQMITLADNNKYLVLSKILYNQKHYLYLIDVLDNTKIRFCCEETNDNVIKVQVITDENLIKVLAPLFDENIQELF